MNSPALTSLTFGSCFSLMLGGITPVLAEDDRRWDAGVRLNIIGGTGKPTNDVLGFGVFGDTGWTTAGQWGSGSTFPTSSTSSGRRSWSVSCRIPTRP